MLTTLLPWAVLVLAGLAFWGREGSRASADESPRESSASWPISAAILAVLALAAGAIWKESLKDFWPTAIGMASGMFLVAAAAFLVNLRGQPAAPAALPTALGVFLAAAWTLVAPNDRLPLQLGAAAGAGLAGWLLSSFGNGPARTAIVAALCLAGDILGHRASPGALSQAGSILGLVAAFAVLLSQGARKRGGESATQPAIGVGIGLAILGLGSWLLAGRHFFLNDLWVLFTSAAVLGLIVAWLVPDEERGSTGFVMAVILWLAAATLAFGLRKGFGLSIVTLGGAVSLLCLNRNRALLTLGPLAMLAMYRVFRELHTDASRALDIGQHYALIGIVIGASIIVLASEWRSDRPRTEFAAALWIPIFLTLPFVSGVVLAAKGFVGVLAGLGFGPFIEGLRGSDRSDGLSLQLGLGAAMAGGYGWLSSKVDLAREDKIQAMIWVAVGLAILATGVAFLSRDRGSDASRSNG